MTSLPLDGVTVVSIEQAVAAPLATRQLADLGARVIKVERPGEGDFARRYDETVHGQASYFVWLNRSEESLTLDFKSERGAAVLDDVLAGADVFVQNLAPGAAARSGPDAATLRQRHPSLIVCDVSGYGSTGSWSQRKAYDLLVQCQTGLVSVTGTEEQAAKVGISTADISAGMYAYSGILSALYLRANTGEARAVGVSLLDHVLGDRDLADDPRFTSGATRAAHREELNSIIAKRFAELTSEQVVTLLDEANVANAGLNSVTEFLHHPALTERDRWREVAVPGATVQALLPPATLSGVEPRMNPVPDVGEHSDAILTGLGRSSTEIDELRARGII